MMDRDTLCSFFPKHEMPLVSILMPVRDDLRTLPDCLESIQKQSLKDWELVAVDDGSSDGSGSFFRKLRQRIQGSGF